jgi:hypothetical protein
MCWSQMSIVGQPYSHCLESRSVAESRLACWIGPLEHPGRVLDWASRQPIHAPPIRAILGGLR